MREIVIKNVLKIRNNQPLSNHCALGIVLVVAVVGHFERDNLLIACIPWDRKVFSQLCEFSGEEEEEEFGLKFRLSSETETE